MPQINVVPDKVILDSFKILSRQQQPPDKKLGQLAEGQVVTLIKPGSPDLAQAVVVSGGARALRDREVIVEEILLSQKSSSISSHASDTPDGRENRSKRDDYSMGSVSLANDYRLKQTNHKNDDRGNNNQSGVQDDDNPQAGVSGDVEKQTNRKNQQAANKTQEALEDDRRRNSWIPCTCPQYKVSKDLISRKDTQAIFFAKVIAVKVIQLLVINLVVFSVAYEREGTVHFFKKSHDWVYLAYGIFAALLLCVRVGVSYRARWNPAVSFTLIIPLTAIICFTAGCITVVYNSILVPLITCTILLSYLMICFTPYLLRKFVMHRATNFIASGFTLLSSIILIFLKEFEPTPMSYWEFISQIWLPGLLLSQAIVQISIIEIQRMLFGLCFNISSKRWHIAAMYL